MQTMKWVERYSALRLAFWLWAFVFEMSTGFYLLITRGSESWWWLLMGLFDLAFGLFVLFLALLELERRERDLPHTRDAHRPTRSV